MEKKPIIAAVVVALAAVGGIFAWQYFFGGAAALTYNARCADKACGWTGNASVTPTPGQPYPPVCPKCKKNTVLPLAKCKKCGHQQNLNEEIRAQRDADGKFVIPGADKLPNSTACEKCGGPIRHGD